MSLRPLRALAELEIGARGTIREYLAPAAHEPTHAANWESLLCRLLEMGLTRGQEIEVCHRGPLSGSPVAVMAGAHLLGIGREESLRILVEEAAKESNKEVAKC